MSVSIVLPGQLQMQNLNSAQCQYSSADLSIHRANDEYPSQKLEMEACKHFANLSTANRTLQIHLGVSCPTENDTNNSTTRIMIQSGFLNNLISKHPQISSKLSTMVKLSYRYARYSYLDLISIRLPPSDLVSSSIIKGYNPKDLRPLEISKGAHYFVAQYPSTFFKVAMHIKEDQGSASINHIRVTLEDFSLELSLPAEEVVADLIKENLMISPIFNKGILSKKQHTDLTIVAQDGTEFNCHKCFLTAQSEVFQAMLLSGELEEAKSNRIEIEDMTSEGVEAFINFIYALDIKPALKNADIAVELLQAGHKYSIQELENSMKRVILTWPRKMLEIESTIEVSIRLFAFARNVDGLEQLKTRAFQVLRKRSTELMSSEYYKELFKKDVSAAMELCALSMSDSTLENFM